MLSWLSSDWVRLGISLLHVRASYKNRFAHVYDVQLVCVSQSVLAVRGPGQHSVVVTYIVVAVVASVAMRATSIGCMARDRSYKRAKKM